MSDPHKEKPPGVNRAAKTEQTRVIEGIVEHAEAARKSAAEIDKRVAGLRARAAIAGCEFHVLASGQGSEYLMARWGWSKVLSDLDAVEQWLDRVEGIRL